MLFRSARVVESRTTEDRIEVELTDPVGGNLSLRLRSLREMVDDETVLETALPVCDVQRLEPIRLSVRAATDLDVRLRSAGDHSLRPQPVDETQPLTEARGLSPIGDWLVDLMPNTSWEELKPDIIRICHTRDNQSLLERLAQKLAKPHAFEPALVLWAVATQLTYLSAADGATEAAIIRSQTEGKPVYGFSTGDGSTTVFAWPTGYAPTTALLPKISVWVNGVLKTLTTDYTVKIGRAHV